MPSAVTIVRALAAQHKAIQPTGSAYGVELLPASGEQFVNVSLMADIKQKVVFRCVEDIVQGDGQLNNTEVGTKVAPGSREHRDQLLANLGGQFFQLRDREPFYIRGRIDIVQYAIHAICAGTLGNVGMV